MVIAHRGCSYRGFNQNTLRAFATPIAEGAQAIELDVQRSSDGELFVFHDLELDGYSNGTGRVAQSSGAYLRTLYAGDPAQGRDPIPTLEQIVELIAAYPPAARPLLNIELKGAHSAAATAHLLTTYLDSGRLALRDLLISSFLPDELAELRRLLPSIPIGVLMPTGSVVAGWKRDRLIGQVLQLAARLRAGCIGAAYADLDSALVSRCHTDGLRLLLFTINRRAAAQRALRMGADGFFSDYWRRADGWLDR